MRHRKHKNQLGVKKEHRHALMANLAVALITHGRIQTTLKKAKALRPFAERLVTLSKKGGIANRRLAASRLRNESAVKFLFDERVEEFRERNGGYTRIYKLGARRGDAAEMAIIEWVGAGDQGHGKKRRKGGAGAKKAAAAADSAKVEAEKAGAEESSEVEEEATAGEEGEAKEESVAEATSEVEAEAAETVPEEPQAEEPAAEEKKPKQKKKEKGEEEK